jgi:hypothetical protein
VVFNNYFKKKNVNFLLMILVMILAWRVVERCFYVLVFCLPELGYINLHKITILCCLNCIYECINGFILLKNPLGTSII